MTTLPSQLKNFSIKNDSFKQSFMSIDISKDTLNGSSLQLKPSDKLNLKRDPVF
jgi:hypothetical protein